MPLPSAPKANSLDVMLFRSQQISTMLSLLPGPKLNIYLATHDRGSDQSGVKKPDHWAVFLTKSPSDADGHVFQISSRPPGLRIQLS